MAYADLFRLSVHAVFLNERNEALFVKTTYGAKTWTLPGGAVDPGETIHETLHRECLEELGREIDILALTGAYYHANHRSHAFVFRCSFRDDAPFRLSDKHSEYAYLPDEVLKGSHRRKIEDCLGYAGNTVSAKF